MYGKFRMLEIEANQESKCIKAQTWSLCRPPRRYEEYKDLEAWSTVLVSTDMVIQGALNSVDGTGGRKQMDRRLLEYLPYSG
ncbi:hypothetical protein OPT61_g4420 [Boeremia exigua]|uniref:Uncharacterized protein n=1 Tax=Boeremia exigua TaxID=749465 RepID=A0ACC2IEB3_9PLEO|nr:hypothetical protein OPT61_g4420 [Boeremia exigua]